MKNDCIFCGIIAGKLPCHKIYEDDFVLAFLDTANDVDGHILVVPKEHTSSFVSCSDKFLSAVTKVAKKISENLLKKGYTGVNILSNVNEDAGQAIMHFHMHIYPRKKDDKALIINTYNNDKKTLDEVEAILKLECKVVDKHEIHAGEDVILYTDGACSGNPGRGGYCAILQSLGKEKIVSGGEKDTTNNRMELMAVIKGLGTLKKPSIVEIYSDSAYVVNAFLEGWIDKWRLNDYYSSGGKPIANKELWIELDNLVSKHTVTFHKVKGHADVELNGRCDEIAKLEASKFNDV